MVVVELDGSRFCAECDESVVPADIDGPDGFVLLRLDYVDGHALDEVEDYEFTEIVANVEVCACSVELQGSNCARKCLEMPSLSSSVDIPQNDLTI